MALMVFRIILLGIKMLPFPPLTVLSPSAKGTSWYMQQKSDSQGSTPHGVQKIRRSWREKNPRTKG